MAPRGGQEGVEGGGDAITLQPHCPGAYYDLGGGMLAMGRNEEARQAFETMTEQDPDFGVRNTAMTQYYLAVGDYDAALEEIERLWGADAGTPKAERLEVFVTLVDDYEAKHHAIDAPDPIAAIEFRMEQDGLSRKDLEPMVGGRARVSEILNRKRPLSLAMVRRLREGLGISADVLVGR